MVTPASLNGAGCALALPAASVEANNNAANMLVFMDSSLLGHSRGNGDATRRLSGSDDVRKLGRAEYFAGELPAFSSSHPPCGTKPAPSIRRTPASSLSA